MIKKIFGGKPHELWIFLLAMGITYCISIYWCNEKTGLWIDEIYTFGLSNSYYAPFLEYTTSDGKLVDNVLTKEDFVAYLTVSEDDAFQFGSVMYNQAHDVHPPLYYFFIHTISSCVKGSFSKWIGLSFNLVLYFFTGIMLFKTGKLLLDNTYFVVLAVFLYGISLGGLSSVLMIRMYMLLTLLTVCFTWCILKMYQGASSGYIFAAGIILLLGLLTQFLFVYFAFFLSAGYCLHEFKLRQYKKIFLYAAVSFMAFVLFFIIWPYIIPQLLDDGLVSGTSMFNNLFDVDGTLLSIYSFVMQTVSSFKYLFVSLVLVLGLSIFKIKYIVKKYIAGFSIKDSAAIMMIISLVLSFLLIAVMVPMNALRYVYHLTPLISMGAIYVFDVLYRDASKKYSVIISCGLILCLAGGLYRSFSVVPFCVYNTDEESCEIMEQYSDYPRIYLVDDSLNEELANYKNPLVTDTAYFAESKAKDILITNDVSNEKTRSYIEKSENDGVLLFVNSEGYRSYDVDLEEISRTIPDISGNYKLICSNSDRDVYFLY